MQQLKTATVINSNGFRVSGIWDCIRWGWFLGFLMRLQSSEYSLWDVRSNSMLAPTYVPGRWCQLSIRRLRFLPHGPLQKAAWESLPHAGWFSPKWGPKDSKVEGRLFWRLGLRRNMVSFLQCLTGYTGKFMQRGNGLDMGVNEC